MDASAKAIASQWANHLPQLSLQMVWIYARNGGFDNRQLDSYTVGSLGLQLTVPLYSGGNMKAGEREAVACFEMVKYKRLEKQREIERETRTAYLNAQTGYSRMASTAREVEARVKARDGQQRGYELGASTIVALLEAKKNLLKSRFAYARARYDYIRSMVALRVWGGTLNPDRSGGTQQLAGTELMADHQDMVGRGYAGSTPLSTQKSKKRRVDC